MKIPLGRNKELEFSKWLLVIVGILIFTDTNISPPVK